MMEDPLKRKPWIVFFPRHRRKDEQGSGKSAVPKWSVPSVKRVEYQRATRGFVKRSQEHRSTKSLMEIFISSQLNENNFYKKKNSAGMFWSKDNLPRNVTWRPLLPLSYSLWRMELAFPNGMIAVSRRPLAASAASYDAQSSSHSVKSAYCRCHQTSYGSLKNDTAPNHCHGYALWNPRQIHSFVLWTIITTKYCLSELHYMLESHILCNSPRQRGNNFNPEVHTSR